MEIDREMWAPAVASSPCSRLAETNYRWLRSISIPSNAESLPARLGIDRFVSSTARGGKGLAEPKRWKEQAGRYLKRPGLNSSSAELYIIQAQRRPGAGLQAQLAYM